MAFESTTRTYHLMAQRWFTHANPTLFNAGAPQPRLCLCWISDLHSLNNGVKLHEYSYALKITALRTYMILWRSVLFLANQLEDLVSLVLFIISFPQAVQFEGKMVLPMVLFPRFECSTTPIVIGSRRKEEERYRSNSAC